MLVSPSCLVIPAALEWRQPRDRLSQATLLHAYRVIEFHIVPSNAGRARGYQFCRGPTIAKSLPKRDSKVIWLSLHEPAGQAPVAPYSGCHWMDADNRYTMQNLMSSTGPLRCAGPGIAIGKRS